MSREPYSGDWGRYGAEPPCEHLKRLAAFLQESQLAVWSEQGEQPRGWVNVFCRQCGRTYETQLDEHVHGVADE